MLEVAPIEADQLSPHRKGSEAGFASQGLWVREMDLQLLPGFSQCCLTLCLGFKSLCTVDIPPSPADSYPFPH